MNRTRLDIGPDPDRHEATPTSQRGRDEERAAHARFPRAFRIRSGADFARVFKTRQSVRGRILTLCYDTNDTGHPRLGLSVGKRLGNAVTRNRIKRIMREVFRLERARIPAALDLVYIPRDREACTRLDEVRAAFIALMPKLARRLDEQARRDDRRGGGPR